MDRGKRVMHPEADFVLNKEPWENEEECEKTKKKARICKLEAELDHVLVTTKTVKQCNEVIVFV
ncbi:unnamed protein product [Arabis nemorensis]|uniref:Uncharacterized protein n=1 Tax=Arabis nemorensis TaxID=586526 RepID=A0A565C4R1_9BRAS|nr:unnamed protein product [Arabis nemorensis]